MRNDALRDQIDMKATIHETMLRVIHNKRRGMSTQSIPDLTLKDVMQFIEQGEFADFKVR